MRNGRNRVREYLENSEMSQDLRDAVREAFREHAAFCDAMDEALLKIRDALSADKALLMWRDPLSGRLEVFWASGIGEEAMPVIASDGALQQIVESRLPKIWFDRSVLAREFGGAAHNAAVNAMIWGSSEHQEVQGIFSLIDIDGLSEEQFQEHELGRLENSVQELANILQDEIFRRLVLHGLSRERLRSGNYNLAQLLRRGTKWIAVIFADLRGSTPAIEIMGLRAGVSRDRAGQLLFIPEPSTIVNDFCQIMTDKACIHGRIEKFVGDSVTCIVGDLFDEIDEQKTVLRAICTTTMMYDTFQQMVKNWEKSWLSDFRKSYNEDISLRLGIGVNYGPAFFDFYGSSDYRQYMAIGDTANTAQRLEELANKPHEKGKYYEPILISQTMLSRLERSMVEFNEHVLDVRGKAWPIPAYGLTGFNRKKCKDICGSNSRQCMEICTGEQWSLAKAGNT
jgi:class 3 adenylate cyclase